MQSDQQFKQGPSLKARALRLLSRREYSRQELARKLHHVLQQKNTQLPTDIEEQIAHVLNEFQSLGWLSDERYAEALVRRRSQRYGMRRVAEELQRAGIESSTITRLSEELGSSEYDRAQALWSRKFGEVSKDQQVRAKQYRFLISKGFSPDLVNRLINGRTPSK